VKGPAPAVGMSIYLIAKKEKRKGEGPNRRKTRKGYIRNVIRRRKGEVRIAFRGRIGSYEGKGSNFMRL